MDPVQLLSNLTGNKASPELSVKLQPLFHRMEYNKGEIILRRGEVSRYCYLVEKGLLRQFYYKNGRDITEHFSVEGNLAACLESLFCQRPTDLLIESIEPSVLHLLDYAEWKELCSRNEEAGKMNINLLEHMLIQSQKKADSWRFETAHERYERFLKDYPEAARRAPLSDIASYLLMTPETLSRIRASK